MSRGREPSYYEIALTQRQVVIAFVIVLLCLVAAFFSGVWVGGESVRGGSAEPVAETAQTAVPQEGVAVEEAGAGSETAEPAPPTLRFFSEQEEGQQEGQQGGNEAVAARGEEPGEAPPPRPRAPAAAATPAGASADQPAATPPPEPRPSRSQPPRATAPAAQPADEPPPIPGQGGPVIQVFSSHDQAQAQKVLDRLLRADYDAFLSPAEVRGIVRFRVRVGPFRDRAEAEKIAANIRTDLKLETWITQ